MLLNVQKDRSILKGGKRNNGLTRLMYLTRLIIVCEGVLPSVKQPTEPRSLPP